MAEASDTQPRPDDATVAATASLRIVTLKDTVFITRLISVTRKKSSLREEGLLVRV